MKSVVRIALVVITVLLTIATLASSSAQAAESQFKWEHFGADPYAISREEAMRTRESAFRKLGLPEEVVAIFMIATNKPGEKMSLNVGDKLGAMLSKGGVVHKNVTVAFVKPPISGKMEYAAPAEKWQITQEGKIYTLLLPEICNNWSAVITRAPETPPPVAIVVPPVDTSSSVTKACPRGIALFVNAWNISVFPDDLQERTMSLIVAAIGRDSENATKVSAYKPDAFSRTLGDEIIRRVNVRAPVDVDIRVRLLDPMTLDVVQDLGVIHLVDGIAPITLTEWQRTNIVETIWPGYFSSPTMSGGERRLWFLPDEWFKKTTTGRWCTMQEHGAFYNKNKP